MEWVSGESAPLPPEAETPPRKSFATPESRPGERPPSPPPAPPPASHFGTVFGAGRAAASEAEARWDFSGLFPPPAPWRPAGGEVGEREAPAEERVAECAMCQEPLDDTRVQWPDCGRVPRCFHAGCLARFRPLRRGLAHLRHAGGDASRVEEAECPLCNHRWGDGPDSAARLAELAERLQRGDGLPSRGCRCAVCRNNAGAPSSEEDDPYAGGPLVLPGGPAPHAIAMCPRHPSRPLRWRHSRGPGGIMGSWECPACDVSPMGSDVPPPQGARPQQCSCGHLG